MRKALVSFSLLTENPSVNVTLLSHLGREVHESTHSDSSLLTVELCIPTANHLKQAGRNNKGDIFLLQSSSKVEKKNACLPPWDQQAKAKLRRHLQLGSCKKKRSKNATTAKIKYPPFLYILSHIKLKTNS